MDIVKYLIKFILIALFAIILSGCTAFNKRIDIIHVMYYRQIIHRPFQYDCLLLDTFENYRQPDRESLVVSDTLTTDSKLLHKIKFLMARLRPDTLFVFSDPGIHCRIHFTDKTISNLCIDWFGNFSMDGQNMGRSDTLCYLIRSYIGFYNFDLITNQDLEILCPEYKLKDCEVPMI